MSNKQAWRGFGIALLIFGLIGFFFYRNMTATIAAAEARRQSHIAIVKMETFLSHVTDAETGQRGYLLTGKQEYLQPYQLAIFNLHNDLQDLQKVLKNHPGQEQRLAEIYPLIQEKLAELQETILLRQTQGFNAAIQLVQTDRGKKVMDRLRALAQAIESEENQLYQERDDAVEQSFHTTLIFSSVAGLLAFGILSIIYSLLMREMAAGQRVNQNLEMEVIERKQAEAEIRKLNTTLEKQMNTLESTNKELEAFAYSVSHDLRAPLRSIDGFSKILMSKAKDKLDEDEQHYLRNLCENSQRMGELIDDLLKLSRLTRAEMQHEPVDLSAIAQDIISEHQQQEPQRVVDLEIMDHLVVNGDSNLLRVLMDNLLGNAWKFTSQKENAHIEFGVKTGSDKPIYYVRDNGAGFNMKYVDKLFGAFQRLHRMEEFPGTGIGLATVARIIHRHGGTAWAEGNVNQGATFYFSF